MTRYKAWMTGVAPIWFTPEKDNLIEPRGWLGRILLPPVMWISDQCIYLWSIIDPEYKANYMIKVEKPLDESPGSDTL